MDERITEYHKMCFKMERGLPPNKKVPQFRDVIDVQRNTLPVIQALRNHALKDRHWEKIEGIIGTALPRADPEAFRLAFLLDLDVGRYKDAIVVVSTEATQESALEEMLAKINAKWAELEFQCVQFKDSKDMVILAGIDDITVALDDSLVSMSTILSSRCDLEKRVSTLSAIAGSGAATAMPKLDNSCDVCLCCCLPPPQYGCSLDALTEHLCSAIDTAG